MSIFGSSATTQKPSLFGSLNTSQPQQSGNGTFGSFGNLQNNNNSNNITQVGQPSQSTNLFGASSQPQQAGGLFGQSTQQQEPQQQQAGLFSLGSSAQSNAQNLGPASTFGASQFQAQLPSQTLRSSLWQPGSALTPREKTIPEQMQTLLERWSPESKTCLFQHYFYNNVSAEVVPYYGPMPGEDEQKWEDALAKKPNEGSIPVLCKGFSAIGNRLRVQVQSASALQARLHEINNSLVAMLQNHDLDISVRVVDARRRHIALSRRCLQLATKVQVLRSRGYTMDSTEEGLKKTLMDLETRAFDPQLSGKQEELWARLVAIRERARFLHEESEKTGARIQEELGDALDEDIVRRTKKILGDYDSQIAHLQREIEEIRKDFDGWEGSFGNGRLQK